MLEIEGFSQLTTENKSDYLFQIMYDKVKDDKQRKRSFLVFIENAEDEDLIEFYDVILHPEKRRPYIDKLNNQIKQWNEELKRINKDFISARMQMYDSLDKNEADNILNNIQ